MRRTRAREFYIKNKEFIILFGVILIYYIHRFIAFRLGMDREESRDANAYFLAMRGYLPYRDFAWLYGPFAFFIYPFIMKVFGVSLLALRVSYIVFVSITIPLAYFLAKRLMPALWAGLAAFFSVILLHVPFYTFNHIFAVLGELACLLMISRYMEAQRPPFWPNLFWAGIFASVVILTKPVLPGIALFGSVFLFLLLYGDLKAPLKRFERCLIFAMSAGILILPYLVYFYLQTKAKNISISYSPLALDSSFFIDQMPQGRLNVLFSSLVFRFRGILPFECIIDAPFFDGIKKFLWTSSHNFVFILPFAVSTAIFFIYIFTKIKQGRPEVQERFQLDRKFYMLFAIFSIFVSSEVLLIGHSCSRANVMQVPFILTMYILYRIKTAYPRRRGTIMLCIILFLFYIGYVDFFHHYYRRLGKYTEPLNLDRASGILVAPAEKKLYESLSFYLETNFEKGDEMVVIGSTYFPQISFLTKHRNIFEGEEYIFVKFQTVLQKGETAKSKLIYFENKIISRIEEKKPRVALIAVDNYFGGLSFITPKIKAYLDENYLFDKAFGPADIYEAGGSAWVKLYRRQEQ